MKHTQLPWDLAYNGYKYVIEKDSVFIADDVLQANAEFVVRACNNHYKLIEAVESLIQDVQNHRMVNGYEIRDSFDVDNANNLLKEINNE